MVQMMQDSEQLDAGCGSWAQHADTLNVLLQGMTSRCTCAAAATMQPCLMLTVFHARHSSTVQERERKERERVVRAKVAASTFARGYLNGIVKSVFQQLQDSGYFYDPVEREVSACCAVGLPQPQPHAEH